MTPGRRQVAIALALLILGVAGLGFYLRAGNDGNVPPGPEGPGPYFVADFESGDISQWEKVANKTNEVSRFEIVEEPVRAGRYALRVTLKPGDEPSPRRDRAEFVQRKSGGLAYEGHERFYGFSTLIPEDFRYADGGYFLITQWHGMDHDNPPLYVTLRDNHLRLAGRRFGWIDLGPVVDDQWVDLVFRVRWSTVDGELEVWRDGQRVCSLKVATLNDDDARNFYRAGTYLKFGPYRGIDVDLAQTLYFDEYRIGSSYDEVDPGADR